MARIGRLRGEHHKMNLGEARVGTGWKDVGRGGGAGLDEKWEI